MLTSNLLTFLGLLLTTTLALPNPFAQSTGNGATSPIGNTYTTTVTFYQGVTSTSSSAGDTNNNGTVCGEQAVSTGNLTASYCITFHTYSAAIASVPEVDCVFALYKGSAKCMAGDGVDVSYVPIPRGNGSACVVSGVLDGGMSQWTMASGVWVCG